METNPLPDNLHEFHNPYLHLIVDDETKLLYSEWIRKPSREEYREAAGIFARCLQEKGIELWIQDTNLLGDVPEEDLKAVLHELVPIAATCSLKRLARITTNEKSMAKFLELAAQAKVGLNTAIEVRQFKTYREAAEWIWSNTRF